MFKKLELDFAIPEELQNEIDKYLYHMNNEDGTSEDCYQTEIQVILNWCFRESILTDGQIKKLREYYQYGGIHNS